MLKESSDKIIYDTRGRVKEKITVYVDLNEQISIS